MDMSARNRPPDLTTRDEVPRIIPVVVRFVPYDQWFITHIPLSWTINQVKTWILAKCFQDSDTLRVLSISLHAAAKDKGKPSQKRSVSPITFASTHTSTRFPATSGSTQGDYEDEDADSVFCDSEDERFRSTTDRSSRPTNPYISQSKAIDPVFYAPPSNVSSRPSVSSQSSTPPVQATDYSLLSFSTLHVLEDRYSVSWYNIRPHELLEVHPSGTIINLSREIPPPPIDYSNNRTRSNSSPSYDNEPPTANSDYIQPYFQAPVKALRNVKPHPMSPQASLVPSPTREEFFPHAMHNASVSASASFNKAGKIFKPGMIGGDTYPNSSLPPDTTGEYDTSPQPKGKLPSHSKRKMPDPKSKFVWENRWIVIRDGALCLCEKKEDVRNPSHSSRLASLVALRGSEHLTNSPSMSGILAGSTWRNESNMKRRVVCAKFQPQRDMTVARKESTVTFSERSSEEFERKTKKVYHVTGLDEPTSGNTGGRRDKDESIWLVIDMLNETAFEHLLRVLHRSSSSQMFSSFLDSRKVSTASKSGSDPNPFGQIPQSRIANRPSFSSLHRASNNNLSVSSEFESSSSHLHALSIDTSGSFLRPGYSASLADWDNKGVEYPSWRADIVMKAQKSGLGHVSKAADFLLGGAPEQYDTDIEETGSVMTKEPSRARKRKPLGMFKPPKGAWRKFDAGSKTNRISEEVIITDDLLSGSSSLDPSPSSGSTSSSDQEDDNSIASLSETEWEGWKYDIKRQWAVARPQSLARSSVDSQRLDLSGYRLCDQIVHEDEDLMRKRVYSDAGAGLRRPLSPLSLTIADISAAARAADESSALWPPLFRTPGAITTSTVTVGRPAVQAHGRKRSSTVTGNTPKKEKKGILSSIKGKEKDKDEENGETPMWRTRPPSLQMSPPPSLEENEMLVSAATARPRARPQPNSRPTSILRKSTASTIDYTAGAPSSEPISFLQAPYVATAGSGSSGRSSPGSSNRDMDEGSKKKGWKRAPSLNGIVRGVSVKFKGSKP